MQSIILINLCKLIKIILAGPGFDPGTSGL